MKKLALTFALVSMAAYAETWSGTISDAHCGAKHLDASAESAACAQKCVKGGAAPVLVNAEGKVMNIENPDAVKDHIGHKVELTGEMKGDAIMVASVAMPEEK